MLLARLFGWIKDQQTFHVFLLELLAVFIGITASLFVDDWRQQQNDYQTLAHLRAQIFANAILENAQFRLDFIANNTALKSATDLVFDDQDGLSDRDRATRLINSLEGIRFNRSMAGYLRLENTPLSIPFDETSARLDEIATFKIGAYDQMEMVAERLDALRHRIFEEIGVIFVGAGAFGGRTAPDPGFIEAMALVLNPEGQFIAHDENLRLINTALQTDEFRQTLKSVIQVRSEIGAQYSFLSTINIETINTIREQYPDISLPVDRISIVGSAASGWAEDQFMHRDPSKTHIWRLRTKLDEGELKFRADENYSIAWGAVMALDNFSWDWSYRGDPDVVFPTGVAQLTGLNIPVKAGHYDITFDSRTFEYSFERVTDAN
jgi:hypothetical protein